MAHGIVNGITVHERAELHAMPMADLRMRFNEARGDSDLQGYASIILDVMEEILTTTYPRRQDRK